MSEKTKGKPFGYLLTLDLYACKEGVCDDLKFCYDFLIDITKELGVRSQSPPFIFHSDGDAYPDKAGLSGWIPLIESGIQIHTLTIKSFISIDVYSCREFSTEGISEYVKKYFGAKKVEMNMIERGVEYFKEPEEAIATDNRVRPLSAITLNQ